MNIFALDEDTQLAAQAHVDKHVVKMITEYAQLLSSAHHVTQSPIRQSCMHLAFENHPSAKWTRASFRNYEWLFSLYTALHDEFKFRYGKGHASYLNYAQALSQTPKLPDRRLMPVFLAMPDHLKLNPPTDFAGSVERYRQYYREHKQHLHSWKKRTPPAWLKDF